ncbi:hypothetical protein Hanom_Chr16g01435851 [Helianthus anomalus]
MSLLLLFDRIAIMLYSITMPFLRQPHNTIFSNERVVRSRLGLKTANSRSDRLFDQHFYYKQENLH